MGGSESGRTGWPPGSMPLIRMTLSRCAKISPRSSPETRQGRLTPTAWSTTAVSHMLPTVTSTLARLGARSAMSSAYKTTRGRRLLLAAGTSSYDWPDFPALDEVRDALRSVVEVLKDL